MANSARVEEVPEPAPELGPVLVQALAVGVCGTDPEIVSGNYGWAPPGRERLILGHKSLGRVIKAPAGSGFAPGDLVAGIVRLPDPVPCPNVFGSVNANRRHYELAAEALAKADLKWLARVANRRVPLGDWRDALARGPDDVKPVIQLAEL